MLSRLLLSTAALSLSAGAALADYTLTILHTNDEHSRIEPINKYNSTCSAEDAAENKCFGGIARVKTAIDAERARVRDAGGNVLVVDAGDQFQGSLFYTTFKGEDTARFMTAIGYDVMAVGNHEFDDGPEVLAAFVDRVNFPVISGNLDLSGSNLLKNKVKPHVVLEVGGEKIGIVSVLATDTAETASPGPNVVFQDEIESLKADVAEMEAQGINKIIALTHVGYAKDKQIAAEVPGIDLVIGGHSHTFLSASDPKREGPYPTWVDQADGTMVPVVTAYAYSKYLGNLEITFDDAGKVVFADGDVMLLDASVEPDAGLAAEVAEMARPLEELRQRVVGEAAAEIDGMRENCRMKECQMGNLVADAMLDRVAGQGISIAIANGGGLRASIDAGPVTMGEVLTVLPFQNTLSTFEARGATIVRALENGASQMEEGAGRFAQVAGLKYTVDPAAEAGARISDVMVMDGGQWAPIDPEKTYGVVTNDYVRKGGDGYKMFDAEGMNAYDYGPDLADVTAEYIAGLGGSYAPYLDGRITVK